MTPEIEDVPPMGKCKTSAIICPPMCAQLMFFVFWFAGDWHVYLMFPVGFVILFAMRIGEEGYRRKVPKFLLIYAAYQMLFALIAFPTSTILAVYVSVNKYNDDIHTMRILAVVFGVLGSVWGFGTMVHAHGYFKKVYVEQKRLARRQRSRPPPSYTIASCNPRDMPPSYASINLETASLPPKDPLF